jgi:hydroxymethylbilane synthase
VTETLRLGTRRSALAQAQSRHTATLLERLHPGLRVELVTLVTRGDRHRGDLARVGGKGLFTEELEAGLEDGTLDLAVHSMKDLPVEIPSSLRVAAVPEREDPRDVLVSEVAATLDDLAPGAVILTGSLRRRAQILARRPDVAVEPIRGNVDTRIDKWRRSGCAGVVLAAAGLRRLGLTRLPAHPLDPAVLVPAPGQGALAVEVRRGSRAEELCRALDHPPSERAARAERALVAAFGGDCTLPLGAYAESTHGDQQIHLTAFLATANGRLTAWSEVEGNEPEAVAREAADGLRTQGADEILAHLRG